MDQVLGVHWEVHMPVNSQRTALVRMLALVATTFLSGCGGGGSGSMAGVAAFVRTEILAG